MAKSIRSKFKRKMRALKREKYSQRELERLKKTTARIQLPSHSFGVEIKKEDDIIEVVPGKSCFTVYPDKTDTFGTLPPPPSHQRTSLFCFLEAQQTEPTSLDEDAIMEVDGPKKKDKLRYKLNPKTLKNEHGNYPAWMSQRRIHQLKNCGKSKGKKSHSTGGRKGIKRLWSELEKSVVTDLLVVFVVSSTG